MAVRSRVRRGGGVVLLLALLFLVGQGLGWLPGGRGGGAGSDDDAGAAPSAGAAASTGADAPQQRQVRQPEPTPPSAREQSTAPPAAVAPTAGSSSPPAGTTRAAPAAPEADSGPPAGSGSVGGVPVPSTPAGEARDGAAFDDRGNARRAIVQTALASDRIGDALAAIERLAADRGEAAVADLRRDAARALAAAGTRLCELFAAGDVLGAEQLLGKMLQPRSAAAAAAVTTLCTERGWPQLAAEGVTTHADELAALPRGELDLRDRAVSIPAAAADAAPLRTRVVAQGDAGVTLRVVGKDGVTFPTVAPWRVAPETVTAAEATELGLSAAAAGAIASARLWCACAVTLGGEPSLRLPQLRAALR